MHALDVIAVLEYSGYLQKHTLHGTSDLAVNLAAISPTPVAAYVPKYTEFKFCEIGQPAHAMGTHLSVSRRVRPPTGLSALQLSLWFVDRDICMVLLLQKIARHRARVFRYNTDAQETAATAAEVKAMHNVDEVFECDGIHSTLTAECKCRSPNAAPATDSNRLTQQLQELYKAKESYEALRPFKERVALYQLRSTVADDAAVASEHSYRTLHSSAYAGICNVLHRQWRTLNSCVPAWTPPQQCPYVGIGHPTTGEPFFKHRFALLHGHTATDQQKLDTAGKEAAGARAAAVKARSELDAFVAQSEAVALKAIGDEAAAALGAIRENTRNGYPALACYSAVYNNVVASVLANP
jgi:hypothetical protein